VICIPRALLEEAALPEELELRAEPGRLVIHARRARSGWAAAAKRMRARGEDKLLDQPTRTGRENWFRVLGQCPVSPDDLPARDRARARRRNL
jgi:hypothetical protein